MRYLFVYYITLAISRIGLFQWVVLTMIICTFCFRHNRFFYLHKYRNWYTIARQWWWVIGSSYGRICQRPMESPHKGPVMRKTFPYHAVSCCTSHKWLEIIWQLKLHNGHHSILYIRSNILICRTHYSAYNGHDNQAMAINSPPGQDGRRFADDRFKCIFMN